MAKPDYTLKFNPTMSEQFTLFYGGIFSNWFLVDFVDYNGTKFNCVEQYMMYHKAMLFNDVETATEIMLADHPREQKALGRTVKRFDQGIWENHAKLIVAEGCYHKFNQHPELKDQLMDTKGTTLVECSLNDKVWGIGFYADAPECRDRSKWLGTNWLGEVLTDLRKKFEREEI